VTAVDYTHVPHPHLARRAGRRPVKVADQLPTQSVFDRVNTWLAIKITAWVGTMICAYIFSIIAFVSLPSAIQSGQLIVIISWIAQTFLQLVLLSIIIVGQNIAAAASDKRAEDTYEDADATLHEAGQIQQHLAAQDKALGELADKLLELTQQMSSLLAQRGKGAEAS
jgi:hypothetical protein